MTHYVCTGDCANEAQKPGVCETEGCSHEGQPLMECSCDDGFHKGVVAVAEEPDVEKMDDEDEL